MAVPAAEEKSQPLSGHLEELRRRIFRVLYAVFLGFILGIYFSSEMYAVLAQQVTSLGYTPSLMQLQGGFGLYMKLGLIGGIITGIPVFFYQMVRFVMPGLFPRERRILLGSIAPVSILFLSGVLFSYYVVTPAAFMFFHTINKELGTVMDHAKQPEKPEAESDTESEPGTETEAPPVDKPNPVVTYTPFGLAEIHITLGPEAKVPALVMGETDESAPAGPGNVSDSLNVIVEMNGYIKLLLFMVIAVALIMEMPVVLVVLARVGILPPERMRAWRKYFAFIIMVITFLLTPDPVSASLLGIPLYVLFEAAIIVSAIWAKNAAAHAASQA